MDVEDIMPYKDKKDRLECSKRHYQNNKEKYITRKEKRRKRIRAWVKGYKEALSCNRCPENHPACLDFHHIDPATKEFPIFRAAAQGYSIERIRKELEKCEVLCSNCHRKEHYNE